MENNNTAPVAKSGSTSASKLLSSEKYSDLTIKCRGREFKVHKAILCPQSEVISTQCDIDMRERRTGVIEHEEFDDDTMKRMIAFAYKKEYDTTRRPKYELAEDVEDSIIDMYSLTIGDAPTTGGVSLPQDDVDAPTLDENPAELSTADKCVIHARVYGLADYYDMPELRDHAYNCFVGVTNHELADADLKGFDNVAREVCKTTMRDDGSTGNSFGSPFRSGFLSLVALYAPKLAANSEFTVALCEPDLQDSAAEIFCALARRISEVEMERDVNTSTLADEKEKLEQSLADTKRNADGQIATALQRQQTAEEQLQHHDGLLSA
jgi:hypothetical protein